MNSWENVEWHEKKEEVEIAVWEEYGKSRKWEKSNQVGKQFSASTLLFNKIKISIASQLVSVLNCGLRSFLVLKG